MSGVSPNTVSPRDFTGQSKEEILCSFGYKITEGNGTFGATIEQDPEAFTVAGFSTKEEAVNEAYDFLLGEVSENLYIFPKF